MRSRNLVAISILIISVITALPAVNAETRIGALVLNPGEGPLSSAVIDTTNGFAYFVTYGTSSGIIVKIRLSDFTRVGALTLPGEFLASAVIDTANGFAYFGAATEGTTTGVVVKVRLSDFTRVGALVLGPPEFSPRSAAIDTTNGFAYFASGFGRIWKIRLSDFTSVGSLALNPVTDPGRFLNLGPAIIDTTNDFGYFGATHLEPSGLFRGFILKIRLSDLSHVGTMTLGLGDQLTSAVMDSAAGFAYFAPNTDPGKVLKVRLSDFTLVQTLTLTTEVRLRSAVIDTTNGFAYFGTWFNLSPDRTRIQEAVLKVRLSDFTRVDALLLAPAEQFLSTAVIDSGAGFAYFGTETAPGIVVKVAITRLRLLVDIDIKPGSEPNSVNVKSNGRIPVAILTTSDFDASTADPSTVRFGKTGTEATPVHSALEDVDGDGDLDMVLHFNVQDTGFQARDAEGTLTGLTFDGTPFTGTDAVRAFFPGDVDGDKDVDIIDASVLAYVFGSGPGSPRWNPYADFDENGTVDIYDASLLASYFEQHA